MVDEGFFSHDDGVLFHPAAAAAVAAAALAVRTGVALARESNGNNNFL